MRDIFHGDCVSTCAIVMLQKTSQPVQFHITPPKRDAVSEWINKAELAGDDNLCPCQVHDPTLGDQAVLTDTGFLD